VGREISIKELAKKIKKIVDFKGKIKFDNEPNLDGTLRKLTNIRRLAKIGFKYKIYLEDY
jgi:GDP-L-fucose synthase